MRVTIQEKRAKARLHDEDVAKQYLAETLGVKPEKITLHSSWSASHVFQCKVSVTCDVYFDGQVVLDICKP